MCDCCPNCGNKEFVSNLNQYDILAFIGGEFSIISSEVTDDEYKIFCRDCAKEVGVKNNEIIIKDTL